MNRGQGQVPLINDYYERYLDDQDSASFIKFLSERYTIPTLERLANSNCRITRRAAVLALGYVGQYESNPMLGRALIDPDRGVRLIAENSIRSIWCRAGNEIQRKQLNIIMRLNASNQHREAIELATDLIEKAPWFAEAWNQRALAYFTVGCYEKSIRDSHQALEINPYHFAAAVGMGRCYLEMDAAAGALESFRRALRLNPSLENIRAQVMFLGRTLEKDG